MMRLISPDAPFMVAGRPVGRCAVLKDKEKPGTYSLCKPDWKLYYVANGMSQAVLAGGRLEEAMQALLEWHKVHCKDCSELAPGSWSYCGEGQDLLAHVGTAI